MTARDYALILDDVIRIARERGILLPASSADPLIPESRLAWVASATATIYIQSQRRGPSSGPESAPPGPPATPTPTVPPESQERPPREGDTYGDYTYHLCPACGYVKPYKKWWPGAKCWDCYKGGKV